MPDPDQSDCKCALTPNTFCRVHDEKPPPYIVRFPPMEPSTDVVVVRAKPVHDEVCAHVWSKTNPLTKVYSCELCGTLSVSASGTRPANRGEL